MAPLRPIGFRPEEISALVNKDVVQQHADNAAFLWLLRDAAVDQPHYRLKDLAALDERVEANLDGLRVAGEFGWTLCEQALGIGEPGEVFMAGVVAFGGEDTKQRDAVLAVATTAPALERALVSALGWLGFGAVKQQLLAFMESDEVALRRIGFAATAILRKSPGDRLERALTDPDAALRARAFKAVGELGRDDLTPLLGRGLADDDEACRFQAAWSAARLGWTGGQAFAVLRTVAEEGGRFSRRALVAAMRTMGLDSARAWFRQLRESPETVRLAAVAAGAIGDPALVEDLIELMSDPAAARAAGEAFATITGADLKYLDLDGEPVEPTGGEDDGDAAEDEDAELPWPDPDRVRHWWRDHAGAFRAGRRHLCGGPITIDSLRETLLGGYQRQRADAAYELGRLDPPAPLFEVRARAQEQLAWVDAWKS